MTTPSQATLTERELKTLQKQALLVTATNKSTEINSEIWLRNSKLVLFCLTGQNELFEEIMQTRISSSKPPDEALTKLQSDISRLDQNIEGGVNQALQVLMLLHTILGESKYKHFVTQFGIDKKVNTTNLTELISQIKTYYKNVLSPDKEHENVSSLAEKRKLDSLQNQINALSTPQFKGKKAKADKTTTCYKCGKQGHFARDCHVKNPTIKTPCPICKKKKGREIFSHLPKDCRLKGDKNPEQNLICTIFMIRKCNLY